MYLNIELLTNIGHMFANKSDSPRDATFYFCLFLITDIKKDSINTYMIRLHDLDYTSLIHTHRQFTHFQY